MACDTSVLALVVIVFGVLHLPLLLTNPSTSTELVAFFATSALSAMRLGMVLVAVRLFALPARLLGLSDPAFDASSSELALFFPSLLSGFGQSFLMWPYS